MKIEVACWRRVEGRGCKVTTRGGAAAVGQIHRKQEASKSVCDGDECVMRNEESVRERYSVSKRITSGMDANCS